VSFITQIDTSTLSNQNLSSALLVHTFTNTVRPRKVVVTIDADQIAGGADYTPYATVQRAGAGSAFQIAPANAATVASGITAASFVTIPVVLNATDVLKVYLVGASADTTTPDVTVRVWEEIAIAPTHDTTIATLASQTSFTLTTGSADDDAYNGALVIIHDSATAVQKASVAVSDYTGSTRTVTLVAAAPFTVAVGDRVTIVGQNLTSTTVAAVTELSATQAEPGQGAPAVNASPLTKLAYLFKAWRNKKTQTSSQYSLYADDASTIDQKAAVSDDGSTTTIGEVASGP